MELCDNKSCCFIGHRNCVTTISFKQHLIHVIKHLISQEVTVFNFGSNSAFDSLCYNIVTELQKQYPNIKRVHYCLPYENYTAAGINNLYEQEINCQQAFKANKKSYLVRNISMIDHSNICLFYYDKTYLPPRRKDSKHDLTDYQPQSGTALAYKYAQQRKKQIINSYYFIGRSGGK